MIAAVVSAAVFFVGCSKADIGEECNTSRDCIEGLACSAGVCSDGSSGSACAIDDDCAGELICAGASGDAVCSQAGDGEVGSACGTHSHCADGLVCNAGACGVGGACQYVTDCADGSICWRAGGYSDKDDGRCTYTDGKAGSKCNFDSACADGLKCVVDACGDGSAGSACSFDSHCAGSLICARVSGSNGICTQSDGKAGSPCGSSTDCVGSLACSGEGVCWAPPRTQDNSRQSDEAHFSKLDGSHKELVRRVKEALHDPRSFEHVDTRYTDNTATATTTDLIVWMDYRAKNALGALVLGQVIAVVDRNNGRVLKITER